MCDAADLTIVLDVPAAVAAARTEGGDAFSTPPSVRRQVECYETHLRSGAHRGRIGTLISLDATRPRGDLAAEALAAVLRGGGR